MNEKLKIIRNENGKIERIERGRSCWNFHRTPRKEGGPNRVSSIHIRKEDKIVEYEIGEDIFNGTPVGRREYSYDPEKNKDVLLNRTSRLIHGKEKTPVS